jgi:hypothetical protein
VLLERMLVCARRGRLSRQNGRRASEPRLGTGNEFKPLHLRLTKLPHANMAMVGHSRPVPGPGTEATFPSRRPSDAGSDHPSAPTKSVPCT